MNIADNTALRILNSIEKLNLESNIENNIHNNTLDIHSVLVLEGNEALIKEIDNALK